MFTGTVYFIRFRYANGIDTGYFLYFVDVFEILSRALVLGKVWWGWTKIHSVALSTLFQVLLRALESIVVQLKWRPPLDDAIAMYFPADPASLHSFPPCLLYQQRGILFIVPVKKYRLLFMYGLSPVFSGGARYPHGSGIPVWTPNYKRNNLEICTS